MRKTKVTFVAIAIVAACIMGTTAWAQVFDDASGAFGSPDPTTGSMVMGWFDIAKAGTGNVLPVIVNMSTMDLGSAPGNPYRVHIIIWDVNSNHVWDKNLQLSPWDVWADASIRDIIENTIGDGMAPAQRTQITETVTIDGVEVERYRGYWTATTVGVPWDRPSRMNSTIRICTPTCWAGGSTWWICSTAVRTATPWCPWKALFCGPTAWNWPSCSLFPPTSGTVPGGGGIIPLLRDDHR